MSESYVIARIRDHRLGKSGLLQVTAGTEQDLKKGIEKVLKDYPAFPYGTHVSRIYRDEMGEAFMADVEHWGSD